MITHTLLGHGDVPLHVREWGSSDAPAILLIHGWSQHHLSWTKQIRSDLAKDFRLVALDLRGHGASGKPDAASAYDNPDPWAGDIAAVIDGLALDKPLLVGWSMGGRVIGDYLTVRGDSAISGVVMVGASATGGSFASPEGVAMRKPDANALGAYSTDQRAEIEAIIAFVRCCSASPLSKQDLALMVGLNMLCPPHVRKACRVRDYDHRTAYQALSRPAMVIHGDAERLCVKPFFEEMVASLPEPLVHIYAGNGHMPFWESADRFNADLAVFARETLGVPS